MLCILVYVNLKPKNVLDVPSQSKVVVIKHNNDLSFDEIRTIHSSNEASLLKDESPPSPPLTITFMVLACNFVAQWKSLTCKEEKR